MEMLDTPLGKGGRVGRGVGVRGEEGVGAGTEIEGEERLDLVGGRGDVEEEEELLIKGVTLPSPVWEGGTLGWRREGEELGEVEEVEGVEWEASPLGVPTKRVDDVGEKVGATLVKVRVGVGGEVSEEVGVPAATAAHGGWEGVGFSEGLEVGVAPPPPPTRNKRLTLASGLAVGVRVLPKKEECELRGVWDGVKDGWDVSVPATLGDEELVDVGREAEDVGEGEGDEVAQGEEEGVPVGMVEGE